MGSIYINIKCTFLITYTEIRWRPVVYLRGSVLYNESKGLKGVKRGHLVNFQWFDHVRQGNIGRKRYHKDFRMTML